MLQGFPFIAVELTAVAAEVDSDSDTAGVLLSMIWESTAFIWGGVSLVYVDKIGWRYSLLVLHFPIITVRSV